MRTPGVRGNCGLIGDALGERAPESLGAEENRDELEAGEGCG